MALKSSYNLFRSATIIKVLAIDGNSARIGIDAPKEVTVHRKEVYDRIRAERELIPGIK